MKKLIAILMALVMVVGCSLTVFAASGTFWNSPSGKPAPTIVNFKPSNENSTVTLAITSYGDRSELPDAQRELYEEAYKSIANSKDITELNAGLAGIIADKNLDSKYLAVSALFDISATGAEQSGSIEITLAVEGLQNFVALLHMNKAGEWELVENARVSEDGKYLIFSVDSFSPFAIVVDTTGDAPQTGDSMMIICTIVMSASIIALACVMHKRKKQIAQ